MANFRLSGNKAFIGGDLTVGSAGALKNFLLTLSHTKHKEIIVDLNGIERWDSSAIQLFVSWLKGNPSLPVTWRNMPPDLVADIRLIGLAKLFNEVSHEQ